MRTKTIHFALLILVLGLAIACDAGKWPVSEHEIKEFHNRHIIHITTIFLSFFIAWYLKAKSLWIMSSIILISEGFHILILHEGTSLARDLSSLPILYIPRFFLYFLYAIFLIKPFKKLYNAKSA